MNNQQEQSDNLRESSIERITRETQIKLWLKLDGEGKSKINTSIGFFDHMLELFARHGFFNIEVEAQGDIHVDFHHTVEDVGICLGKAFNDALGDKAGILRFGSFTVPMYEALANVDLDICGRPYLVYNTPLDSGKIGDFDAELVEEFLHSFVNNSGTTLHVNVYYGTNLHHIAEAIFKALAKALKQAVTVDESISGVLSTKGVL